MPTINLNDTSRQNTIASYKMRGITDPNQIMKELGSSQGFTLEEIQGRLNPVAPKSSDLFGGSGSAGPGATLSSDPYRDSLTKLGESIDRGLASFTSASDAFTQDINDRRLRMKSDFEQEAADLGSAFDLEKKKLGEAQGRDENLATVRERQFGYIPPKSLTNEESIGSEVGALTAVSDLQREHAEKMTELELRRRKAIREARTAYDDKDYKLAEAKMGNAKTLYDQISSAQDDHYKILDNIQQAQERQVSSERADADKKRLLMNDIMSDYKGTKWSDLPENQKQMIMQTASDAGIPLNFVINQLAKPGDDVMKITRQAAILDLVSKGITSPTKIFNYLNVDDDGRIVGDMTIKEIAETIESITKKTPVNTAEVKKRALKLARPELEKSRGEDGYVDPTVYLKLRSDYAEAIGSVGDYDSSFAVYLSPEQRARLGIGKAAGVEAVDEDSGIPEGWN